MSNKIAFNKRRVMKNTVFRIIRIVGTILSVGVLMVLGIKYMMGSAQEKAEYKKTFVPYIIGAILVCVTAIITIVLVNGRKEKSNESL